MEYGILIYLCLWMLGTVLGIWIGFMTANRQWADFFDWILRRNQ